MKIDLTKLIYGNVYELPVEGEVIIPDEFLIKTDIRKLSPVKVSGFIKKSLDEYELDIKLTGTMILPCARTLKDVEYPFNIKINEAIGDNDDNSLEIIQNRLEILPIIWQYILMEVPLRVISSDAKEEPIEGDGWRVITEDDEKETIDKRLSKLKDYIKE